MKKLNYLFVLLAAIFLASCSTTSYYIKPAGDLTMVSTRNVDGSVDYVALKTYAGVSGKDVDAAIATAKNGILKKKNPIIKEINSYKAEVLNEAVDNVVKSVAGGEYLKNVKFYWVQETTSSLFGKPVYSYSYIASGDVWGVKDANANIKGFRVNDKVVFTLTKQLQKAIAANFTGEVGKQYAGVVVNLKASVATVKLDNGTVLDLEYVVLTNMGQ
jgi:hypothetical protein